MNGNGKLGRARPWAVLALAAALACGQLCASSALAKKPPPPPQPPAGWEVIILHPQDCYSSAAYGTSGGQQVGEVCGGASLWNGTAESCVDLHPDGAWASAAYGVSGGQQVGYAYLPYVWHYTSGAYRAGVWSGTADSWVDLHPAHVPDIRHSTAFGTDHVQQVGMVGYDLGGGYSLVHACVWNGTAESFVDLHAYRPESSYFESRAYAVADGQQVGFTEVYEDYGGWEWPHASLWTGTAESWVDLNPNKALTSCAYDVSDGRQVGYVTFWSNRVDNWVKHAAMWKGNAGSWVDLHPSGYVASEATGVSHGYQAGYAWTGYDTYYDEYGYEYWVRRDQAGMWSGTPESWVNLHALLPADYATSIAWDIEVTPTDIWVVGWAFNPNTWHDHAVLWHKTLSQ